MLFSSTYKPWFIGLIVIFTLANGIFLTQTRFDFNVENLFPRQDEDLTFFQENIDQFQSDKKYLIIGIKQENGIFNQDFLFRLEKFTNDLDSSALALTASSITNIKYYIINPFMKVKEEPFLHLQEGNSYEQDSLFLSEYQDVKEKFISSKGQGVALYLELKNDMNQREEKELLVKVEELLQRGKFQEYHFSGSINTDDVYQEALKSELTKLLSLSLILILIVIFLTFRSVWGVIVPFSIILLTVMWTMGSMAAFGVSINVITVLIPSVIAIVALSDVIHIMSRYKEERKHISNRRVAMNLALKDIGIAIFLTSITTAFGFLTLGYADIQPFIEFGMFTALGVIYAWFLAVFLLPLLLVIVPENIIAASPASVGTWPIKMYSWVSQNHRLIIIATVVLLSIAGIGIMRLKVDSKLYEELSAGDNYSSSLHFFDQHFAGIRPVEIYLEVLGDGDIFEIETLSRIDSLDKYLMEEYGVNGLYSVNTQIKRFNRSLKGGRPHHFTLPTSSNKLELITQMLKNQYKDLQLNTILSQDYKTTMISAKISDLGSFEIRQRNKKLEAFLSETFPPEQYRTRITGKSLLLDRSNEVITYNLGYGLLTALLVVAIIMGILFKSVRMSLIALVPNVLPLFLIAGIMGLFDVGLKMSTAVIFTVSFGIAVDDTIHFLSRFNTELKKTSNWSEALKITYYSTGRAIMITSFILVLGFGVLMFSEFTTNFITGFFVSLSLLFAVFADLFLLPVLLIRLGRE